MNTRLSLARVLDRYDRYRRSFLPDDPGPGSENPDEISGTAPAPPWPFVLGLPPGGSVLFVGSSRSGAPLVLSNLPGHVTYWSHDPSLREYWRGWLRRQSEAAGCADGSLVVVDDLRSVTAEMAVIEDPHGSLTPSELHRAVDTIRNHLPSTGAIALLYPNRFRPRRLRERLARFWNRPDGPAASAPAQGLTPQALRRIAGRSARETTGTWFVGARSRWDLVAIPANPAMRFPRRLIHSRLGMVRRASHVLVVAGAGAPRPNLPSPPGPREILRALSDTRARVETRDGETLHGLLHGSTGPAYVVRVPLRETSSIRLARAWRRLSAARRDHPWLEALTPTPIVRGASGGCRIYAWSFVAGRPAGSLPATPPDRSRWLISAVDFLARFHRESAHPGTPLGDRVSASLRILAERCTDPGSALSGTLEALRDVAARSFRRSGLPRVFEHGDFNPGNIMIRMPGETLCSVLDWDSADPHGVPYMDLVHLLLSLERLRSHRDITDVILEEIRGGEVLGRCRAILSRYRDAVGLPEVEPVRLLFLYWVNLASRHARHHLRPGAPSGRLRRLLADPAPAFLQALAP